MRDPSLTLVNSGCTAGSYGPANATNSPGNGGSFNVPYITVDAKGRVTSISNRTVNMPNGVAESNLGFSSNETGTFTSYIYHSRLIIL